MVAACTTAPRGGINQPGSTAAAQTAIPLDVSKYEDAAFELGVMSLPFFGLYRCVCLDVVLTQRRRVSVLARAGEGPCDLVSDCRSLYSL